MAIFFSQQLEVSEVNSLSSYAIKSNGSIGRFYPEPPDPYRLAFQIDRDRIIHCRSFRRLKGKTQVFISHYGDHYRTRLSHTIEVAQLARDISRNLGLNEDLAEAIALAHDLGHTPFGHAGEAAMNEVMRAYGGYFEHNEQSQRVVEILETGYPDFPGLNLTHEVRQGLIKHQTAYDNPQKKMNAFCLEAQVVDLSDEIAYQNHDIDDGLRSGIITLNQLEKMPLMQEAISAVRKRYAEKLSFKMSRNRLISHIIKLMVTDVLNETERKIQSYNIKTLDDIQKVSEKIVTFSSDFFQKNKTLRQFLWDNLYFHPKVHAMNKKAAQIIHELFKSYYDHPTRLPADIQKKLSHTAKEVVIKDYIAGMTDKFAISEWKKTTII